VKGKLVFAMDAVFGLPRKKSAGDSYCEPLFCNLFFDDQSAVDEFVANNEKPKSKTALTVNTYTSILAILIICTHLLYKTIVVTIPWQKMSSGVPVGIELSMKQLFLDAVVVMNFQKLL
jgi:hypothetical protein